MGIAGFCCQHLEAVPWLLLHLFRLKRQTTLWTCETDGEIYNETDIGTELFSSLNTAFLFWITPSKTEGHQKLPRKGSTVGANFTDCEKPEVCEFLLLGGQYAIFTRFSCLTILSSDVILGRISKIYRAFTFMGRQGKQNYEGHRDQRIWPHCSKQPQQFPVSAKILLLRFFFL